MNLPFYIYDDEMVAYCRTLERLGINDGDIIEYCQWTPASGETYIPCKVCFWHETMQQYYPRLNILGTTSFVLIPLATLVKLKTKNGEPIQFSGLDMKVDSKFEWRLCCPERDTLGLATHIPIVEMHKCIREEYMPKAHTGLLEKMGDQPSTRLTGVFFCPGIKWKGDGHSVLLIIQGYSNGDNEYLYDLEKNFKSLFFDAWGTKWQEYGEKQLP